MLNYLWGIMILLGVSYAAVTGTIPNITEAALTSSKEAVSLCITMVGVMAFWTGLMKIAEACGIISGLGEKMEPLIHFLFPRIPKDHPAKDAIVTNFLANIFGLGWAATPAGLKAMEALAELNQKKGEEQNASNEMCIFLILNISSLQLIPVNVIAYRSQYGSSHPAAIVGPAILATAISTIVGILFCKIMDQSSKKSLL